MHTTSKNQKIKAVKNDKKNIISLCNSIILLNISVAGFGNDLEDAVTKNKEKFFIISLSFLIFIFSSSFSSSSSSSVSNFLSLPL
jgi:hypothetical protein